MPPGQPELFHSKVVVRAGFGMYYDRGELFSYFSPGYAIGTVTGGPFGVNQQLPFVNASVLRNQPRQRPAQRLPGNILLRGLHRHLLGRRSGQLAARRGRGQPRKSLRHNSPVRRSQEPQVAASLAKYLPNLAAINNGAQPISLGVYDRANKLPYTYNYTLDVQWQPRNDLAITLGYVGNLGRHQVIPVPFNQPQIASSSSPIHGETYSYGYNVGGQTTLNGQSNGPGYDFDYEGGNVDHRVPYIGYAAESIDYKAAGIDAYNALTAHIEKRMSHGIQVGASYTYSHALDEQSGLGLFYNGSNPLNLRRRLRLGRLRPHPRPQLHLRLPAPQTRQGALPHRRLHRTAGPSSASPSSKAASPTRSSTSPAPSAASTTASPTASPTPSSRSPTAAPPRPPSRTSPVPSVTPPSSHNASASPC